MITDDTIQQICENITEGKSIYQKLPDNGELVIDRVLPFICIYRFSPEQKDAGIVQLVQTQASYLIVPDSDEYTNDVKKLVNCVAKTISDQLSAFLIFEIWPTPVEVEKPKPPTFKILCPKGKVPATIETLTKGLYTFRNTIHDLEVEEINTVERHPPHLAELMPLPVGKDMGCLIIGLEIPPIYKDLTGDQFYYLFFRVLKRKFSEILKKAAFEFIRIQTSNQFSHYLMLGKSQMNPNVGDIDKKLADISGSFDFLLKVSPVNYESAWKEFKENHFKKKPKFHYRLITVDPEKLKRELYNIALENIDDPTLGFIFRDKRKELDRQISMLEERNTPEFLQSSINLYGNVDEELLQTARAILQLKPRNRRGQGGYLNSKEFAFKAKEEIDYYQQHLPGVKVSVEIRPDVSGLIVSQGTLYIGTRFKVPLHRVDALIQHEVGTHVLTYYNGKQQPLKQLYAGLAGYDEWQEGIAVMAEYLAGGLTLTRLRLLAARVVAVHAMIAGQSFVETFLLLHEAYGYKLKKAYNITVRVFRGGGLTKDLVYLRGLVRLLKYYENKGNLTPLFVGKIAEKHVPFIEELIYRNIISTPVFPRYMEREDAKEKINQLQKGKQLLDLIQN